MPRSKPSPEAGPGQSAPVLHLSDNSRESREGAAVADEAVTAVDTEADAPVCDFFMDVLQVAQYLRVSKSTVYKLIESGRIPSVRIGRLVRVSKFELDESTRTAGHERWKRAAGRRQERQAGRQRGRRRNSNTHLENPVLVNAISEAKTVNFEAPSVSGSLEEATAKTEELKGVDYATEIKALQDAGKALSDSIEQMKLVNPSEAFVIERHQAVEGVGDVSAVTEDNDPNGKLGKDGGYTATVYFISPLVDQSFVYGDSVIEKGTTGSGAVEVYATAEDANKRNDYLAGFDGGILSSGSHTVVGTVLVRTSDKLTASQQDRLEAAIIESLTRLG